MTKKDKLEILNDLKIFAHLINRLQKVGDRIAKHLGVTKRKGEQHGGISIEVWDDLGDNTYGGETHRKHLSAFTDTGSKDGYSKTYPDLEKFLAVEHRNI